MLNVCTECLTPCAVGLEACPRCGRGEFVAQGSPEHEALLAGKRPAKRRTPRGTPRAAEPPAAEAKPDPVAEPDVAGRGA